MTCLHLAVTTAANLTKHGRELRRAADISKEIARAVTSEREALAAAEEAGKRTGSRGRSKSPGQRLMNMMTKPGKVEKDPLITAAEKAARQSDSKASAIEKKARDASR